MVLNENKANAFTRQECTLIDYENFDDVVERLDEDVREKLGLVERTPEEFFELYDSTPLHDVTTNPNANIGNGRSYSIMRSEFMNPILKKEGFRELYNFGKWTFGSEFTLDPIFQGRLYMHDSTKLFKPYCIGVSSLDILIDGRPYAGLRGAPPKHFDSFCGQVVEYLINLSGEFAGATAVSDWFVVMAWYVDKENISMDKVRQTWQNCVHVLHNKFGRIDGDPPYTNVSINSPSVLLDMFSSYVFPDGKNIQDILPTIMEVQRTVAEFMHEGDPERGGMQYTFPVVTCNFKRDECGKSEWWKYITRINNNGVFNICVADMFSSCCRLLSDFRLMLKYKTYSNGSGGVKIGSHRVVTLNLPMLADDAIRKSNRKEDILGNYIEIIDEYMKHASQYLVVHKTKMLPKRVRLGYQTFFAPFKDHLGRKIRRSGSDIGPWLTNDMLFSTIGVTGIPDAVDKLTGVHHSILTPEGFEIAKKVLTYIVEKANGMSGEYEGYNCFFNVEQVPAESADGTMAWFNGDEFYSNQFVPLDAECSIWDRVRIEGELSNIMTGGSMTFLNLNKMLTPEQSVKFHERIMEISDKKLNQLCINYAFTVCTKCKKKWVGSYHSCPDCGMSKTIHHEERVVGYMVKTTDINENRFTNDVKKRYRHDING